MEAPNYSEVEEAEREGGGGGQGRSCDDQDGVESRREGAAKAVLRTSSFSSSEVRTSRVRRDPFRAFKS